MTNDLVKLLLLFQKQAIQIMYKENRLVEIPDPVRTRNGKGLTWHMQLDYFHNS